MTVTTSALTAQQTELYGAFLRAYQDAKGKVLGLAQVYKACVDAGMDMSYEALRHTGISPRLVRSLSVYAGGQIADEAADVLLLAPGHALKVVAALPKLIQRDIVKNGVAVDRDGEDVVVSVEDITAGDAKVLIDVTGGRARILTPAEQRSRKEPRQPSRDRLVTLRMPPEVYGPVALRAHKAGHTVERYLIQQMFLEGILEAGKSLKRGEAAETHAPN